jgi:hypothetical protein
MTRSQIFTAVALVLIVGSAVLGQTNDRVRTFTGNYTCIACDLNKTVGAHSQCDIYGHNYGIKLTSGTYIHLLPNDHSVDLVKGGGRSDFKITVTGIYDANAHTIDVQKYSIDGVETRWSEEHHKMEMALTHKQLLPKDEHNDQLTKK